MTPRASYRTGAAAAPVTVTGVPGVTPGPRRSAARRPRRRPTAISTRSVRSSRSPTCTGTRSALPSCRRSTQGLVPAGVDGRRRARPAPAARSLVTRPSAKRPATRRPPVFGTATKMGTCRVTGSADGAMRSMCAVEGLPGIAAHVELDGRAQRERRQRLRRHRRLEQHARRVDDGDERRPGRDDVAAVDRPVAHDAADGRGHDGVVQLLPHRGEPRAGVGQLRLRPATAFARVSRSRSASAPPLTRLAVRSASRSATASACSAERTRGLRREQRVLERARLDARDHRAPLHRLAFLDAHLEHRARHLRRAPSPRARRAARRRAAGPCESRPPSP